MASECRRSSGTTPLCPAAAAAAASPCPPPPPPPRGCPQREENGPRCNLHLPRSALCVRIHRLQAWTAGRCCPGFWAPCPQVAQPRAQPPPALPYPESLKPAWSYRAGFKAGGEIGLLGARFLQNLFPMDSAELCLEVKSVLEETCSPRADGDGSSLPTHVCYHRAIKVFPLHLRAGCAKLGTKC